MNDDNQPNPGPQPWHDPALEARIVAWVMGEASAFEVAELERLVAETPELALFKRRLEAVHGLAAEASRPVQPKLQLSAERRRKLLDVIGTAPAPAPESEKKVRALPAAAAWWKAPVWSLLAACLIVAGFVATIMVSGGLRYKAAVSQEGLAQLSQEGGFVTANVPMAASQPVRADGFFDAQDVKSSSASYNYQTSAVVTGPSAGGLASAVAPVTTGFASAAPAESEKQILDLPAEQMVAANGDAPAPVVRQFSGGWGKGSAGGGGVVTGSLEQANPTVTDGNVAVTAGAMVTTGVVTPTYAVTAPDFVATTAPVASLAGPAPAEDRRPELGDVPLTGRMYRQAGDGLVQAQVADKLQTDLKSNASALRTRGGEIGKASPPEDREGTDDGRLAASSPSTPTAFETRPRSEMVDLGEVPRASLTADMDGAAAPAAENELERGVATGRAISANSIDSVTEEQKIAAANGQETITSAVDPVTGEVVVFDGFVNYGSPIMGPGAVVEKGVVADNVVINQPVFSTRRNTPDESKTVLRDENTMTGSTAMKPEAVALREKLATLEKEKINALVKEKLAKNVDASAAMVQADAQIPLEKAEAAKKLVTEGNTFKDSGRYDLAFKRYEQTLQADPYNIEARLGMEVVNQARAKNAQVAANEANGRMLWADASGERPLRRFSAGASEIMEQPQVDSRGTAQIQRKLDDIIIPKIDFQEATVAEALEFLKKRSEALDTAESDASRKGVNVVLKLDPDSPEAKARITLNLTDIPLRNAIDYVSKAASLKTKIEPYAVAVVPLSENTEVLITKEYKIPADFLARLSSSGTVPEGASAKDVLKAAGVQFPQGASAYYLKSSGKLIIRNTQANIDLVETAVENMPAPTPTPAPTPKPASSLEIPAAQQPFSTFSLHVSDVSFLLAKDALARGERPDPARIRTEEFYNAFDYNDPAPGAKEEVACRIEECAHPFLPQRDLVRVALKVAAAGRAAGQPLRLTILLDTSGSMEREDRAASVRRALAALAAQLGPQDRVTLIGFARTPRLLADAVPGDQAAKLVDLADRTPSEGGTNLEAALALASEMALKQKLAGAQNRIVLLTDGAANLGNADPARLAKQITRTRQQGISFDACGVGANGLDDEMLEALTRKGDGRYYFLNKPEDADAGFARQLAGALRPAAENVKVQVVFNPLRVNAYRLFGFEQHLLKKEDFRNDKVQAAELSAEEAGVALYQVQTLPNGEGDLGQVFVRFRDPASGQMVERSWPMPYEAKNAPFDKAAPSLQLAATAAFLAESLRGDPQVDLEALAPAANRLRAQYGQQARVGDLVQMIQRLRH